MSDEIPASCIERGEGYACWLVAKSRAARVEPASEGGSIGEVETSFDTQMVYRPVRVEVNDGGEAFAYYFDDNPTREDLEREKYDGRIFVPPKFVYAEPLPHAEPAYRHEADESAIEIPQP